MHPGGAGGRGAGDGQGGQAPRRGGIRERHPGAGGMAPKKPLLDRD